MDDALGMRGGQRAGHPRQDLGRRAQREPPRLQSLMGGAAGHVAHHQIRPIALLADVEHGHDAGVVERGRQPRLLPQTRDDMLVAR